MAENGNGWKPKMKYNEYVKKGDGRLLQEAMHYLDLHRPTVFQEQLKDSNGTFAVITTCEVLCARHYIYGFIISAHKQAVYSALNLGFPLVMFIGNQRKFYKFDPKKIIDESEENERNGAKMLNWNIKLGFRMELEGENDPAIG